MRLFVHGERRIALFNAGGALYATDEVCTHDYAELTQGYFEPDDCTIECPLHGSVFDIRSGRPLTLPAFQPLAIYRLEAHDDGVYIDFAEAPTLW